MLREIFDHLQQKRIQPFIKIRSNANPKAKGSPARARAVRELKDLGLSELKEKYNYERRWAAESVFSTVKRISGEHVMAMKTENMMQEIVLKFAFYNLIIH